MNTNKVIWFSSLLLLSAHVAGILSRATLTFSELKLAYILSVLTVGWFFKSQFNQGFRQAIANTLNLDEGEYGVILFCIFVGLILGGAGTWTSAIL